MQQCLNLKTAVQCKIKKLKDAENFENALKTWRPSTCLPTSVKLLVLWSCNVVEVSNTFDAVRIDKKSIFPYLSRCTKYLNYYVF